MLVRRRMHRAIYVQYAARIGFRFDFRMKFYVHQNALFICEIFKLLTVHHNRSLSIVQCVNVLRFHFVFIYEKPIAFYPNE